MAAYAKDVLVETGWLEKHLDDPKVRVVEVDEDPTLYLEGHIPGAVVWQWDRDLNDPLRRDFIAGAQMEELLGKTGIGNDTTIVLYGDKSNWFATYTYWLLLTRGVTNVKILNGGRARWAKEGLPMTRSVTSPKPATYRLGPARNELRALRRDVEKLLGQPAAALVDVRSPQEYTGEMIAMPTYPQEGARRGGHIPGAVSVPWGQNVREDGTFKTADELRALYEGKGVTPDRDIVAYCRIGERASLTWFALHELLGYSEVRNYDGSWTEWGNLVAAPITKGASP
ncbi:MAG TPA: sulfurtransferase [Candidatus Thermoplasmatota archaeon]|jgi:thiosulfate/3-mercaptopyruvate sulfurtransferase|nr:sulfurtransferase [Candidatus Thermoplasmatota archaeon]